jgi:endonuclease/exonuclease/phosphatase family metal-dependent hydrolase
MFRTPVLCLGLLVLTSISVASTVRVATFNTSLNRKEAGLLAAELSGPGSGQAERIAAILQRVRPDIVLLNEFDHDADGLALAGFQANYLAIGQQGETPIEYAHHYAGPVNTGVPSGVDFNGDGKLSPGHDSFGWGLFPGQYGMVLLSRFPIDEAQMRTFQLFLWKDLPDARFPVDPVTNEPFYSDEALEVFRLSSKSHWDVPVRVNDRVVHVLASHPTPPVFDGPEDRNGCRNHDEIRFWVDYLSPDRACFIVDDNGRSGGLPEGADFVLLGDLNADPFDGDSVDGIRLLLEHPRVTGDFAPYSDGAVEAANRQRRANDSHQGDPATDTADFSDSGPGNLRADFNLPSRTLTVVDGAVFWPIKSDPTSEWIKASDHRLVWVDLDLEPEGISPEGT